MLFGAPGAGKGTQAALVAEKMGLAHITTGELFRENIRQGTELGKKAKPYYDAGQLVPDELTIGMLLDRISRDDCARGCMLDGFPRNLEQAHALDRALDGRGEEIDKVLYIKVSPQELLTRLAGRWSCRQCGAVYHERGYPPREPGVCDQCGGPLYQRDDDKPEVARQRLDVYLQNTAPLIDYYRERGKLLEIDGEQAVEAVGKAVLDALRDG
ncbi:MAG: adenylate kinase [Dehalococcoidia bacterium]